MGGWVCGWVYGWPVFYARCLPACEPGAPAQLCCFAPCPHTHALCCSCCSRGSSCSIAHCCCSSLPPWWVLRRKKEALHEKELGNEAYKRKEFEAAITHYNRWGPLGWLGGQQRGAAWPWPAAVSGGGRRSSIGAEQQCSSIAAEQRSSHSATRRQTHPALALPRHPALPCTALYRHVPPCTAGPSSCTTRTSPSSATAPRCTLRWPTTRPASQTATRVGGWVGWLVGWVAGWLVCRGGRLAWVGLAGRWGVLALQFKMLQFLPAMVGVCLPAIFHRRLHMPCSH